MRNHFRKILGFQKLKLFGVPARDAISFLNRWEEKIGTALKEDYGLPEEVILRNLECIGEILLPFLSPRWEIKLFAPHPELQKIAHRAIFWREINGVRIVSALEADACIEGKTALAPVGKEEKGQIEAELDRLATRRVAGSLYPFRAAIGQLIRRELIENVFKSRGISEELFPGTRLSGRVSLQALETAINYALVFSIIGDYQHDFSAFLRMWRIGNFPLAIDEFSNLVVVCAPRSVPGAPWLTIVK